jgi:hypothetical protein
MEKKTHKISVRFPADDFRLIRDEAYRRGKDVGPFLAEMCRNGLEGLRKKRLAPDFAHHGDH